ncbi:MAG: hypothetical protein QOH84_3738, partial [Kribbellaceae bacterium]|nr:hypothetical protein [Kribbellaceae bacterium]
MGRNLRTSHDRPASSLRGRAVVVAGVLLALLGGWVVFDRSTGDDAAVRSPTNASVNRLPTRPPTNAPANRPPTSPPTVRLQQSPTTTPVNPATSSTAAGSGNAGQGDPTRILLPQLELSARVLPIAAEDGVLTPPPNPRVAGWWSGGARPGAKIGSAVITAHTVHTGG